MKRRLSALALGVVLSASGLLAASPASAAVKDGTCQSGENCMYNGFQLSGSLYDNDAGNDGDLGNNNYVGTSTSVNNSIGSIYNRTGLFFGYYLGYNYANFAVCLPNGTATSFSAGALAAFNNNISSHKSLPYCD